MLNRIFHGVSFKIYCQTKIANQHSIKKKPNQPCQPLHMRGQDIENVLSDPRAKVRHTVPKLSNKQFINRRFFSKFHWPTPASVGSKNCCYTAVQTSYQKYDTTLRQSVLFQHNFFIVQEAHRHL